MKDEIFGNVEACFIFNDLFFEHVTFAPVSYVLNEPSLKNRLCSKGHRCSLMGNLANLRKQVTL